MSTRDEASESTKHLRELAAQLHAARENLATLSRALSRSRLMTALVRSVQQLGVASPLADDLASRFLQLLIEHTLCDTAALLQRSKRGEFVTVCAIGHGLQSQSEELILPGVPSFLTLPGGLCPSHVREELHRAYGKGSTLWSLHSESGLALLLCSKQNSTIEQKYGEDDRELVETALSLYISTLRERGINLALTHEKQAAHSRLCSSRTMMGDLLDILDNTLTRSLKNLDLSHQELDTSGADYDSKSDEIHSSIVESLDLIRISKEMLFSEDIPLSLNLSWMNIRDVIIKAATSMQAKALSRGVCVKIPENNGKIVAYLDGNWTNEIIKKIIEDVIEEATYKSTIIISAARRSDRMLSVTIRWSISELHTHKYGGPALHTTIDYSRHVWKNTETARLVQAFGGAIFNESIDSVTRQAVWTFSSGD